MADERAGQARRPLLSLLVQHSKEAILASRFALMIPLLGVTSDLLRPISFNGQQRVDRLRRTCASAEDGYIHVHRGLTLVGDVAFGSL